MQSVKYWTAEEDLVMQDLTMTAKEAACRLVGRTAAAVKQRRTVKGLRKINPRKKWTAEDTSYIKESRSTDYALGKEFGVGWSSIKAVRRRAGIVKVHTCLECDVEIGGKGKYCKDHRKLSRQISYYKHRFNTKGGDLTDLQIRDILKLSCTYCGTGEAMGIDRLNSSLGYTLENAVPCCRKCNVMKMEHSRDDWMAHMRLILEHCNEQ